MEEVFQPDIPHTCPKAAPLSQNGRHGGSGKNDLQKSVEK